MTTKAKTELKPGVKSSEFWLAAITQVIVLGLIGFGKISGELGASLITGGAAAYGGVRTVAKVKAGR